MSRQNSEFWLIFIILKKNLFYQYFDSQAKLKGKNIFWQFIYPQYPHEDYSV